MWIFFAMGSAVFAGFVAILVKIGIKNVDSTLATAIRTVVVVIFAWLMVFVVGSQAGIKTVEVKTLLALVLSGLATGGSWLFYFKALQIGDINKVVPVDKSSNVLTILLSLALFREGFSISKIAAVIAIGAGTYMMIERKESAQKGETGLKWLLYAGLGAVFASLTAILGKIGIANIDSTLGTAIRTVVVLIMAWAIVLWQGTAKQIKTIDRKSWLFLGLSGFATGGSWLCYYRALQEGPASIVVPIDKLSILISIAFGYIVFRERLNRLPFIGLVLIVLGTLSLVIIG